ncbi:DUF4386 domain-containing protein [Pseudonocardia humida]|uniref:DUF4386 domain-containing protein n=1 Tax=Pseudonocardia humida TaxID=2800819 RepID=A0ABT1A6K5_9PSEU|nr:DUF4386 domain-containing protein [Pseudonocardia humida]MCO1658566.1 DUF4386 domain-containing protein [Pseudonocardia humida]
MTTATTTAAPTGTGPGHAPGAALGAGLAYLGVALAGMTGFLVIRAQLYVPGDAAATAANLVDNEGLARLGVAADLALVLTQAVAALYFLALLRPVNRVAAAAVAAFGLVNSVVVLVGTAFTATALEVAVQGATTPGGDAAVTALLLYDLNDAVWGVGNLFFGLWLMPMGWAVRRSATMPSALGWILVIGGVGYVLSAFAALVFPALPAAVAQVLVLPATVGEFWMIGYLLLRGRSAAGRDRGDAAG